MYAGAEVPFSSGGRCASLPASGSFCRCLGVPSGFGGDDAWMSLNIAGPLFGPCTALVVNDDVDSAVALQYKKVKVTRPFNMVQGKRLVLCWVDGVFCASSILFLLIIGCDC
jgi:hypothetical protein